MKPVKETQCPTCRKPGNWLAGEFAPFCSKRCRLVDLGKWLGEQHRVSEPLNPENNVNFENLTTDDAGDKSND